MELSGRLVMALHYWLNHVSIFSGELNAPPNRNRTRAIVLHQTILTEITAKNGAGRTHV